MMALLPLGTRLRHETRLDAIDTRRVESSDERNLHQTLAQAVRISSPLF